MRICLVYDCLFPWTVGGAERWYRNLAERLAERGHEVTYLTLRQWEEDSPPAIPGVNVVAVGPRMALYSGPGQRRIAPPLVFGLGVLVHLLRFGRRYDVLHTASFPYFSLLAASLARALRRAPSSLVVDWHEVWSPAYWQEYLGRAGGAVGWLVQKACARVRQRAFCFSALHAQRLVAEGLRDSPTILRGEFEGSAEPAKSPGPAGPEVVFAGRHIPEKRVPALVDAFAHLHATRPALRLSLFGDGPEFATVRARIEALGLGDVAVQHGFAPAEEVGRALSAAACHVLPSRREGYGLVVVEAAAKGTPSVVVAGEDNAATELIEDGVNGVVAGSAEPNALAQAITRVLDGGAAMRESTADWYSGNEHELSLDTSLTAVVDSYSSPRR